LRLDPARNRDTQLTRLAKVFADVAYTGLVGVRGRNSASASISGDVPKGPTGSSRASRWRVERTFAWLCRNRRLGYDYEATVTSSQTFAHAAAVVAFTLARLHATR
jgi:hypothetical protein